MQSHLEVYLVDDKMRYEMFHSRSNRCPKAEVIFYIDTVKNITQAALFSLATGNTGESGLTAMSAE